MQRKIIHVDMDCFYAAIEVRDNPCLAGKPVAVGGKPGSRGVLATANYAARQFKVRSAMASSKALELCPHLIIVPPRMEVYKSVSEQVRQIFQKYTSKIEFLSLDEAFLDVSHSPLFSGSASLLARRIRREIQSETGVTASAGISYNKTLAKIASDWNKPNGQFIITPQEAERFLKPLDVSIIPGIGKKAKEKLNNADIFTCQDMVLASPDLLRSILGTWAIKAQDRAKGIDEREVVSQRQIKSISVEETFIEDLVPIEARKQLDVLLSKLERRISKKIGTKRCLTGSFVKIKFNDFKQTTAQNGYHEIDKSNFLQLFDLASARSQRKIRLVGVGVNLDSPQNAHENQMEISFSDNSGD